MILTPRLLAAFAVIYLVWGSTYLAIRYAIESIPPFVLGGVRFTLAGLVLYLYTRLRGGRREKPEPETGPHWRNAILVGGLLLLGGNGLVNVAEKTVPSGLAALIVGSVPLWMVLIEWLIFRGQRPSKRAWVGLAIGMAGIIVLVDPRQLDLTGARPLHVALVLCACISWSFGSLLSRRVALPASPLRATAMEMLAGGVLMLLVATTRGEWTGLQISAIHAESWLALAYLIVFGSLIAFSCYIWLLKHATPAAVSTYAYANPIVAVFLGWAVAGEVIGPNTLLATPLIIIAVILITLRRSPAKINANQMPPRQDRPPAAATTLPPARCGVPEN